MYFRNFVIISPWQRAESFIWTNLNPLHPSMFCAKFCQNWPVIVENKIFKICHVFSQFSNYLPLKKGGAFHLDKLESRHPRMLCAKFGWNWPSGSGEENENVKSLRQRRQRRQRQRRRTTDKFWSEKLTWAFGSGELKRLFKSKN